MSFEGRVTVDIERGAVAAVKVAFTQPGDIDRLLKGKTPEEALQIVPAVFSLCGMAQVQAAQMALDAATGVERSSASMAARQCLTEMESLRENALRIALDWPRFVDEPIDAQHAKSLMRLVPEMRAALSCTFADRATATRGVIDRDRVFAIIDRAEAILAELVFGEPLDIWRSRRDAADVKAWASSAKTVAARLLARISAAGWETAGATPVVKLSAFDAEAVRHWLQDMDHGRSDVGANMTGAVPETTLMARHAEDARLASQEAGGLWSRLAARLIELSLLPERMRAIVENAVSVERGRALGGGVGLGEVTAARGLLAHVAVVARGRIADYRIVPPTRWNFAENGVAQRAIRQIATAFEGDTPVLAELAVNAIDPCVGHTVRVN